MQGQRELHVRGPSFAVASMSRRRFLAHAGTGAAAVGFAGLLAACTGDQPIQASDVFAGDPQGEAVFANWPIYIDEAKDENGKAYIPSLRRFTDRTGIDVEYLEVIQDTASFFAKIQPQLAAGDPTGYDIFMAAGRQLSIEIARGWLIPLGDGERPNFDANAAAWAKDPPWDPGNTYSMPWQGGFTGLAVNHKLLPNGIRTFDDLADPEKVGRARVGMIKTEMPEFVMINLGIDVATSGPAEWKEAAAWLTKQREAGVVRAYYEDGYIDDLVNANLAATMAWSGDVFYYGTWAGYPELEFDFPPDGGAIWWADNMVIPQGAEHPVDALALMDYYYDPVPATMVAEWVLYMSPVSGVQDRIRRDAEKASEQGYKGYAGKLEITAENPFLFPDEATLARTQPLKEITSDDELNEWNAIFGPISQS